MNDPYRLTDAPHDTGENPSLATGTPGADRDRVTALLWVALALCAALNAMFSVASPNNLLPSLAFGAAGLGCVGLLVARYLGRRRS